MSDEQLSSGLKVPAGFIRAWFSTLRVRIVLSVVLVIVILVLGLFATFQHFWLRAQEEAAQRRGWGIASNIASQMAPHLSPVTDELALSRVAHSFLTYNPNLEIHLVDGTGKVLQSFTEEACRAPATVDLDPLRRFLAAKDGTALPIYGSNPCDPASPAVFSAAPVAERSGTVAFLYAVLSSHRAQHLGGLSQAPAAFRSAFGVTLLLLCLAILAGRAVVMLTMNRFRDVMAAVNLLRAGDLSARAQVSGEDELGILARSFNEMAGRISEDIRALSERDEKRRELIANVWHDIRTPVAGIGVLADMLKRSSGDSAGSAEQIDLIEKVNANVGLMSRMLSELQELGRLEVGDLRPVLGPGNILGVIDEVLLIFEHRANERGVQVSVDAPAELPPVSIDGVMITRVLTNLLENAARYTHEGGAIRIEVTPDSESVVLSVADTGSGIDPVELPHIFERRFQGRKGSHDSHGVSGLGLTIVKTIVEQHGGHITVESSPGRGSRFSFSLRYSAR